MAKNSQTNFDDFCNNLASDTIDRIYDFAGDDDNLRLNAFWNFAEMILFDAVRFSHHRGGNELAVSSLRVFETRMREHYEALGLDTETAKPTLN